MYLFEQYEQYEEEIQLLHREISFLNKLLVKKEDEIEQQAELIYTLKQTYYKEVPDDSEGEASSFYDNH